MLLLDLSIPEAFKANIRIELPNWHTAISIYVESTDKWFIIFIFFFSTPSKIKSYILAQFVQNQFDCLQDIYSSPF